MKMFTAYLGNCNYELVPDQEILEIKKGQILKQAISDPDILLVFDGLICIGWIPSYIIKDFKNEQQYC